MTSATTTADDHKALAHGPIFLERTWLWLLFSSYYFVPLFYHPFSLGFHGLLLTAYGIFVWLFYFVCKHISKPNSLKLRLPLAGIILLGALVMTVSSGGSTLLSYAGFITGFTLAIRQVLLISVLQITLLITLDTLFTQHGAFYLVPSGAGLLTITGWGYLEQIRARSHRQSIQSKEEIRNLAAIAERERIARDLHDLMGHSLSSIAISADLTEKLLERQRYEEAMVHIRQLHQVARQSLDLVRQTVSGYKHRGLSGEVPRLCHTLRQRGFSVYVTGVVPMLSPIAETMIILALTELTTNILRHSKGNQCELIFKQTDTETIITLTDNGKEAAITPGNGLSGINERLSGINARCVFETGEETRFNIHLPFGTYTEESNESA